MDEPHDNRRVFLGRASPLIANAARWLLDRHGPDLGEITAIVAGGRASRLLLAELVAESEARSLPLVPPTIATPSQIPRALGAEPRRPAGALAQRLAWAGALRSASRATLSPLIPHPPSSDGVWARYAEIVQRAADDLAWHGLRFSDVRDRSQREPDLGDEARWAALDTLQRDYLDRLGRWNLADHLLSRISPSGSATPIVLIGVLALPALARDLVAAHGLIALIYAPESESNGYDELGLVSTAHWLTAPLEIDPQRVVFADGPRDQADAALGLVATTAADRFIDEVTLGICDPALGPFIERIGERAGHVAIRSATGQTVQRAAPHRLLRLARDLLRDRSFAALAALVRHPDAERAMRQFASARDLPAGWLDAMDRYAADHLPTSLDHPWRAASPESIARLDAVRSSALELLDGLWTHAAPPRQLANNLLALLDRLYGDRELAADDPVDAPLIDAIDAIVTALGELHTLGDDAALAPADAIDHVLAVTRDRPLSHAPRAAAIEALGWLELASDPSPVLVLVGLNEGAVPSAAGADPILSDRVRAALGMETDDDRLARDSAILRALLDGRESVSIVVGRRSAAGDPLAPSRLLFRADREQNLAIALRWIAPEPPARARLQPRRLPAQVSDFSPAPVLDFEQPRSVSVTSFRDFIASPYQFYLRHLLGLGTRSDRALELDGRAFGILVHETLRSFGNSDARTLDNPERIEEHVLDALATIIRRRIGDDLSPTLRIQRRFAEQTLVRFARWQAQRQRDGWRIHRTEWPGRADSEHAGVAFDFGADSVLLRGRIDRIDRCERTGEFAILDYKTALNLRSPADTRKGDGTWLDLQLPLYRHLARSLLDGRPPIVGYVSLDASSRDVKLQPMDLTAADFDSADSAAREILRKVRQREVEAIERFDAGRTEEVFAWIAGIAIEDRSGARP